MTEINYRKSPCCGELVIRTPLNFWKDGRVDHAFGHVGICPKCRKVAREPKLWRNAPAGYSDLWPLIRPRFAAGQAFDVEIVKGCLVPFGDDPDAIKAEMANLAKMDEKNDYREDLGYDG